MKAARIDVGSIRREQIVDAAIAIIAEQGIQHLSLSEIEKKTGLVRGQLTYYYRTKEDILLAVFDRLLQLLHERVAGDGGPCGAGEPPAENGWDRCRFFLTHLLLQPPEMPAFHPLQYTFLSQIGHRADFRAKLAGLYDEWRRHMTADLAPALARRARRRQVSPRTVATLVQAILHGLAIQRAADPDVYDRREMLDLVLDLLGSYLRPPKRKRRGANKSSDHQPARADGNGADGKTRVQPNRVRP